MGGYKNCKEKALANTEVKAEYDALGPEYDLIQTMIDARVDQNITQKELSARIYPSTYKALGSNSGDRQ